MILAPIPGKAFDMPTLVQRLLTFLAARLTIDGKRSRRSNRKAAAGLMACALLAACGVNSDIPRNPAHFGAPDAPKLQETGADKIGPLDTITLNVFQVPDLSGDFQVDPMGYLSLPLIGRVYANGKGLFELQRDLKRLYGTRYLQNPDLSVELKSSLSQRLTVDGSVGAPGIYPVTSEMTLMQAVAAAKGVTSDANTGRVVIFRKIDGEKEAAAFSLRQIRDGRMSDPKVYANDIIVVDGSALRETFHDVILTVPLLALFRPF